MPETNSPGAAIERFLELIEKGDVHIFGPDDITELKELAKESPALRELVKVHKKSPGALSAWVWIYETTRNIAIVGGAVKSVLTWVLFMVGTWVAFKAGLAAWLAELLKGAK